MTNPRLPIKSTTTSRLNATSSLFLPFSRLEVGTAIGKGFVFSSIRGLYSCALRLPCSKLDCLPLCICDDVKASCSFTPLPVTCISEPNPSGQELGHACVLLVA